MIASLAELGDLRLRIRPASTPIDELRGPPPSIAADDIDAIRRDVRSMAADLGDRIEDVVQDIVADVLRRLRRRDLARVRSVLRYVREARLVAKYVARRAKNDRRVGMTGRERDGEKRKTPIELVRLDGPRTRDDDADAGTHHEAIGDVAAHVAESVMLARVAPITVVPLTAAYDREDAWQRARAVARRQRPDGAIARGAIDRILRCSKCPVWLVIYSGDSAELIYEQAYERLHEAEKSRARTILPDGAGISSLSR